MSYLSSPKFPNTLKIYIKLFTLLEQTKLYSLEITNYIIYKKKTTLNKFKGPIYLS